MSHLGLGRSFHEFIVADRGNDGAYVARCADARSGFARGAAGRHGVGADSFCPLQLALVTPWRPAPLPPISFAIMLGSDGVLLLGLPTLKDLGVDPFERIWDSMQQRVSA